MESNKAVQNRVPVINDVAGKEPPTPKPAKAAKGEKAAKGANVKVVDVVLKQSPENNSPGPQQNPKANASAKADSPITIQPQSLPTCQMTPKPSPPTCQMAPKQPPTTCQSAPKQASPTCQLAQKQPSPTCQMASKQSPPTCQMAPKQAPPACQMAPKQAPPACQMAPKQAPPACQMAAKQSPPACQMAPKQAPPASQMAPKDSPPACQMAPKQAPPVCQMAPKDSPPACQMAPKQSPPACQIAPKPSPPTCQLAPKQPSTNPSPPTTPQLPLSPSSPPTTPTQPPTNSIPTTNPLTTTQPPTPTKTAQTVENTPAKNDSTIKDQPLPCNQTCSQQPLANVALNQTEAKAPSTTNQPDVQLVANQTQCQLNGLPVGSLNGTNYVAPTPVPVVSNHVPVQAAPAPPAPLPSVAPTPAAPAPVVAKVHKHKDEKHKKEDKSVTHVLKALNSLNTTEEKLAALCKKYADMFDENRKLQLLVKQSEKKVQLIHREKEQLQSDHSKAILTRSRLESLCRELQKQNKAIKEESISKMREEEIKRTEISQKFQNTLSEITALMQQNNEKNNKLRDDNVDMTSRLKTVCEQYQLREQQVEKLGKQMELEVQLCDAKLAKAKMEMTAEKEILLREKQQLLLELTTYQNRCQELQGIEVDLRSQIALYNEKYDEFQQALSKSSQVFTGFKGEMEKMSKKITKLEKETSTWKKRWEQSHQAVLEMAVDKQVSDQELKKTSRQLLALQSLCRTLQTERTELLATVKKLSGGGELSEAEKMVNTENGPEAIETLMTKIENECEADNKQETPPTKPLAPTPSTDSPPQATPNTAQATQCALPTPVDEKTSKNRANAKSKSQDKQDSGKATKEEGSSGISESLASIEQSCKSVSSLGSDSSVAEPPSQANDDKTAKNKSEVGPTPAEATNPVPKEPASPVKSSNPVPKEPPTPPPAVAVPEKTSSEEPKSPVVAVDSSAKQVVSDLKAKGDSAPVVAQEEKKAPVICNSQPAVSPESGKAKTCDKKEPKLVAEQKKKEPAKKRKK